MKKYFSYIFHPAVLVVVLLLSLHAFNITRYDFFAEKDSYGWLAQYEKTVAVGSFAVYRPSFGTFSYILHSLTGLDIGHVFKYVVPLFSLLLVFPLWVVATDLNRFESRFFFLLMSAASPVIVFQMESTRPQILAIFFLYFVFALGYLFNKKEMKSVFDFVFGFFSLVGIFIHGIFAIFLGLWVLMMFVSYREYVWRHRRLALAFAIVASPSLFFLFNLAGIDGYFAFATHLLRDLFINIVTLHTNFHFPASYVNSDGNSMGWPGLMGVAKYYGYYVGPFLMTIAVGVIWSFLFSKRFRGYMSRNIFGKEFSYFYALLIFLLLIAEIFPRFADIALLPDRAWTFLGVLFIVPFFHFLKFIEVSQSNGERVAFFSILLFSFGISMAGAVYVNLQFQYLSSPAEMESFRFIRERLPSNRTLFLFGYDGLIRYHSQSATTPINESVLSVSDPIVLRNMFSGCAMVDEMKTKVQSIRERSALIREDFSSIYQFTDVLTKNPDINKGKNLIFQRLYDFDREGENIEAYLEQFKAVCKRDKYVYLSRVSDRNPFRDRSYETGYNFGSFQEKADFFDKYPGIFKEVFDNGQVRIWQITGL